MRRPAHSLNGTVPATESSELSVYHPILVASDATSKLAAEILMGARCCARNSLFD